MYASAAGSNRNTGRLATAPKPYPNNVLRIYTLGPTQTLFVDTGDYPALYPTVFSPLPGRGDDEGFVLTGPTNVARVASLHHANPLTRAPVVELFDADFVTLSHMTIHSGTMGLWAHDGSTNLTAEYLTVQDNLQEGIRVETGSAILELGNSTVFHNGFGG